jgi:hypothetical protein
MGEKPSMARKLKLKLPALFDFYRLFLGLAIFEGLLALWFLFRIPSEAGSAILAGYSLQRIGSGLTILFILVIFIFLLLDSFLSKKLLKFLASRLEPILEMDASRTIIKSFLIIVLSTSLIIILFFLFPSLLQRVYPFFREDYVFTSLGEPTLFIIGSMLGWSFLLSMKILILYSIWGGKATHTISTPTRLMIVSWIVEIFAVLYFAIWSLLTKKTALEILQGPGVKILILCVWFSLWSLLSRKKECAGRISLVFTCISIWLCVFLASLQFAQSFNVWSTGSRGQFILLASSFLHGKIYLITTPRSLYDLTFYNGHWYVPFPPFPAILLMPFVALWGIKTFNLSTFSMMVAATASVTMYLILDQLIQLGWIKISRAGAIWLTALFQFGTVFLWLSITMGPSFLAQVVTVLFYGLAFLTVLKKYPPWISGICLAAAILSRPNVLVLWPALLAIVIQLNLKEERVNWKRVIKWSLLSAVPVILGAGFLLYYNYLRFGNFLDFGYKTINGSAVIVYNVQKYGIFNTHYVPFNLRYMFLALPELKLSCKYYIPRGWGMSIVFTTPAVIYLLRKFKVNWWIGGCWCSIIVSIILLALYSNNGANQYGYRYVMDFLIPIIMIIAFNAGERVSGVLKTIIIASILINYYGIISWHKSPC